ncbi:hypothetical protein BN946_scf184911.g79 [Trametes cinnabarina]|uniref:Uncharacterized protein n=1 Tax=Pycnoporus cinnabarinus TaxID=5643 RepID=A0A060SH86_PYCCI|nr:hypothetical protein BN946_scf184911.g79 [Trametes cinnabarina]
MQRNNNNDASAFGQQTGSTAGGHHGMDTHATNFSDSGKNHRQIPPDRMQGDEQIHFGNNDEYGAGFNSGTGQGPTGTFAPQGGHIGTHKDSSMQGGMRGDDQTRFANNPNDNYNDGSSGHRQGSTGPFASHDGQHGMNTASSREGGYFGDDATGRDNNNLNLSGSRAGGLGQPTHGHAGAGDKIMGNLEKAAGRVSGNANLVERGELRKTGGSNADDTAM